MKYIRQVDFQQLSDMLIGWVTDSLIDWLIQQLRFHATKLQ